MLKVFKNSNHKLGSLLKTWRKLIVKNQFLILVLLLALGLRLVYLNGSFWLDEAAQALESQRQLSAQLDLTADFQPPLIHLLTHLSLYVSSQEWWLRLIAATIPGLVTIWATYQIGIHLFSQVDKKSSHFLALSSALLLATSSFHIFYSQELRPYSLPAMIATLSWLVLLKFDLKKNWSLKFLNFKLHLNRSLVLLTIITTFGIYSSYLYPFLVLSQLVYVLWLNSKLIKPFIWSSLLAAVTFFPWLPSFWAQLQTGQSWRDILPGWDKVVSIPPLKSIFLVIGKFLFGVVNLDLTLVIILFVITLGLLTLMLFKNLDHQNIWQNLTSFNPLKKHLHHRQMKILLTLMVWLLVPLLSAWLVSWIVPILRPKRVLYLMPAFYLLITSFYLFAKKKVWAQLLIGLLLLINLWGTAQYYLNSRLQREDWRHLHQLIMSDYSPYNSVVLFSFPHEFAPWDWYEQQNEIPYQVITTGSLHVDHVRDLSQRLKTVNDYQYVLLFDYLRDLSDPEDKIIDQLEAFGFVEVDIIDQTNIGFVRVFAQQKSLVSFGLNLKSPVR